MIMTHKRAAVLRLIDGESLACYNRHIHTSGLGSYAARVVRAKSELSARQLLSAQAPSFPTNNLLWGRGAATIG